MVNSPTYSTSIFESLGVLSNFSISETIWKKHEKFALSKIKESTIKIRGALYYLKNLTPSEASKELKSINPLMPVLSKLRISIEAIDDKKFSEFRKVALDFFDTVDLLCLNLQDVAHIHSAYELSRPALATDWDSCEDEHWDNY